MGRIIRDIATTRFVWRRMTTKNFLHISSVIEGKKISYHKFMDLMFQLAYSQDSLFAMFNQLLQTSYTLHVMCVCGKSWTFLTHLVYEFDITHKLRRTWDRPNTLLLFDYLPAIDFRSKNPCVGSNQITVGWIPSLSQFQTFKPKTPHERRSIRIWFSEAQIDRNSSTSTVPPQSLI